MLQRCWNWQCSQELQQEITGETQSGQGVGDILDSYWDFWIVKNKQTKKGNAIKSETTFAIYNSNVE